jgi:hypothetical protein
VKHLRRVKLLALSAAAGAPSLIVTALPAQAGVTPTPIRYGGPTPVTSLWQSPGCGMLYAYGTGFNQGDFVELTLHDDGGAYTTVYPRRTRRATSTMRSRTTQETSPHGRRMPGIPLPVASIPGPTP